MSKTRAYIPYSYTLLVVALLHASVWSIGVIESHSRQFFLREHANIQAAAGSNPTEVRSLLAEHLASLERLLDQSRERVCQLAKEREATETRYRASAKSAASRANRLAAAARNLVPLGLVYQPAPNQNKKPAAAAAAAAAAVRPAAVSVFA